MKDRVISFDTETTGLNHRDGDRLIEFGAVEIVGNMITGKFFHMFVNPGRQKVHPDAFRVHGISDEDLKDKPSMDEVMPQFLEFIGDSPVVIHNAPFDMGFVNNELAMLKMPPLKNKVVDTLSEARKMFPMGQNSLDSLCRRYGIDTSKRVKHGAHIDAELLADVYINMLGLNQLNLGDNRFSSQPMNMAVASLVSGSLARPVRPARPALMPSEAEISAHSAFVEKKVKNPVWAKFF
ncbi:DNA polymerase III subunit epsilon [Rhizobium sp. BK176]|uniref:DNA polymerase III subunit epsilon n=1 Tax=Rhizobium sp. BK176 TaxID=2587071 RepID=UPI0021681B53|nr:DNA polymerase III subunit epsilon [Rhizobium sp. BK176]MCS4089519.1 DNA polymerase-3 subunit epsilon [Rhizobium sp. BK176]